MARYYYDKYTSITEYYNYRNPDEEWIYRGNPTWNGKSYEYVSYGFSSDRGFYNTGSKVMVGDLSTGDYFYSASPDGRSISRFRIERIWYHSNGFIEVETREYNKKCEYSTRYLRGDYIETIVGEDGQYPINGRDEDGYWYVRKERVFPALGLKINGNLKTAEMGWVKVNGTVREIDRIYTKINGVIREVV